MTRIKHQVQLKDNINNKMVTGYLSTPVNNKNIKEADKWKDFIKAYYKKDSEDAHWKWGIKKIESTKSIQIKTYAIEKDNITQGMMVLKLTPYKSRQYEGRGLVYVDYLAGAPWNRKYKNKEDVFVFPQYSLVGTHFIRVAKAESIDMGYNLLGLSALPDAEDFYRKSEFVQIGENTGDCGLNYFELKL